MIFGILNVAACARPPIRTIGDLWKIALIWSRLKKFRTIRFGSFPNMLQKQRHTLGSTKAMQFLTEAPQPLGGLS